MNSNIDEAKVQIKTTIVELFEINKLPEEKREEAINNIGKIIFQSVLARVLPLMAEEDLAEYDKLLAEESNAEALLDFFFAKIPNFLEIVAEESETFRREAGEVLSTIK